MHRMMTILVVCLGIQAACVGFESGCTKQQAADVTTMIVNVAVGLCQEAPQVIPAGTPAGNDVGLLCPLVNDASKLVPVIVSAAGWNALKAEALAQAAKDAGPVK